MGASECALVVAIRSQCFRCGSMAVAVRPQMGSWAGSSRSISHPTRKAPRTAGSCMRNRQHPVTPLEKCPN